MQDRAKIKSRTVVCALVFVFRVSHQLFFSAGCFRLLLDAPEFSFRQSYQPGIRKFSSYLKTHSEENGVFSVFTVFVANGGHI